MAFYRKQRKPIYDKDSGVPPTEDEVQRMRKQAKNVVEYWLAQAAKSRFELRTKILNKGITVEVAELVLDEYVERGFINDEDFAEQFVYSKVTYDKLGKRTIAFKLREKGISQDIIDSAVAHIDDEDEFEQALDIAVRKARRNGHLEAHKRVQQIAGMIARKGYSGSVAFKAAKEAIAAVDEESVIELDEPLDD